MISSNRKFLLLTVALSGYLLVDYFFIKDFDQNPLSFRVLLIQESSLALKNPEKSLEQIDLLKKNFPLDNGFHSEHYIADLLKMQIYSNNNDTVNMATTHFNSQPALSPSDQDYNDVLVESFENLDLLTNGIYGREVYCDIIKKALKAFGESGPSEIQAQLMEKSGLCHLENGNIEQAKAFFEELSHLIEKNPSSDKQQKQSITAKKQRLGGFIAMRERRYDEASDFFKQAFDMRFHSLKWHERTPLYLLDYSVSLLALGKADDFSSKIQQVNEIEKYFRNEISGFQMGYWSDYFQWLLSILMQNEGQQKEFRARIESLLQEFDYINHEKFRGYLKILEDLRQDPELARENIKKMSPTDIRLIPIEAILSR